MSESLAMMLASAAGMALGTMFFGGLWWTLRKVLSSHRPTLWFAGSLLVRTVAALAGFYLVSAGRWQRLLACLAGFIAARMIVTLLTRDVTAREGRHEP